MHSRLLSLSALLFHFITAPASAGPLKINGSTTVNLPVAEAAEILHAEKKLEIQVDTQGGSSGGISMLGEGLVQIGMSSKHISEDDKKKFPKCDYREIHIGEDAVALIVSKDVWDGGVKSFVDFMLSEPGQKLVKKHGYLMLSELKVPEGKITATSRQSCAWLP